MFIAYLATKKRQLLKSSAREEGRTTASKIDQSQQVYQWTQRLSLPFITDFMSLLASI